MIRVAVIGGGAVGLATADALLARGGVEVVLLERDQIASGSSGLNIGVVETQYVDPLAIELRVYARRFFDRLADADGLEFVRCGYLRPAYDAAQLAGFARSVDIQRSFGVEDARVIDRAEIARLAPDLRNDDMAGALFGPSDGYVDPHRYCGLLADRSAPPAARSTPARASSAPSAAATAGNRDRPRRPRGGRRHRRRPLAAPVGALLGAPVELLQRRSAAIAYLSTPIAYVHPFVMNYVPGGGRPGAYIRHERPDQLVVGTHSEEAVDAPADPDHYPRGVTQDFLEDLAEQLVDRLPGLADRISLGNGWSGLYPVSPVGPRVGPRATPPA